MSNETVSPAAGLNRRGLLAAVGGVAAVGALPAVCLASPTSIEPSADFHEIVRIAAAARNLWDTSVEFGEAEDRRAEEVQIIEAPLYEIEQRLHTQPPTLSSLLDHAALTLYWSDAGSRGFDDPVGWLTRLADGACCTKGPGLLLAAAVFEAAGMGGANV
jgi:hypothetical protein